LVEKTRPVPESIAAAVLGNGAEAGAGSGAEKAGAA
jgi:hypothetical protein